MRCQQPRQVHRRCGLHPTRRCGAPWALPGENGRRSSGFLARARPRAFSSGWWVRGGRSGEFNNSPDRPPQGSPLFARFQAYGMKAIKVIVAWPLTLPRGALWVCGHDGHVAWPLTPALAGVPRSFMPGRRLEVRLRWQGTLVSRCLRPGNPFRCHLFLPGWLGRNQKRNECHLATRSFLVLLAQSLSWPD